MVQVKISKLEELPSAQVYYDVDRKYAFVIREGVLFYVSDVDNAPGNAVKAKLETSFILVDQIKRA